MHQANAALARVRTGLHFFIDAILFEEVIKTAAHMGVWLKATIHAPWRGFAGATKQGHKVVISRSGFLLPRLA